MRTAQLGFAIAAIALGTVSEANENRPMTGAEFQSLVDGRTVHYSQGGKHYGSEQFLGDGRAIWQYTDGECIDGFWREVEEQLCFFYASLSCWQVSKTPEGGFSAISETGIMVDIHSITDAPLNCGGALLS